jgi:hypothetical protein
MHSHGLMLSKFNVGVWVEEMELVGHGVQQIR